VIIGDASSGIEKVFRDVSADRKAPLLFVDHSEPPVIPSALAGIHQEKNARTAIEALKVLREKEWRISDEHMRDGFSKVVRNTGLLGRWQIISEPPYTVADVAHNVDGIRAVGAMLERIPYGHLHIVFGTVNDKDPGRVFAELPKNATYYFCKADIPRGLGAIELMERAALAGLKGRAFDTVQEAYKAARTAASLNDLVLVTGSVFVVAEVI
jgi:dihydrofolate synthase/folylpolyglutamate synthase